MSALNHNFRKDQPCNFGLKEKELEAMKGLQEKLVLLPVLVLLYAKGPMLSDINAGDVQVGCVLM